MRSEPSNQNNRNTRLQPCPQSVLVCDQTRAGTLSVAQVAMSRLSLLPEEVLKLVMQLVPQKDRLGSCCLVSRRLHAAAVAATQELELRPRLSDSTRDALLWLFKFGQGLTRLEWDTSAVSAVSAEPLRQLPCPNLLQLTLYDCVVDLRGADDCQPGLISGCTKLTRLELFCDVLGFFTAPAGAVVDSLSSLVHLQHLEIEPKGWDQYTIGGLSGATLPRLQHLTYLSVHCLSVENLSQLGALTSLQTLFLWGGDSLRLGRDAAAGPSSVPGLAFPASLKTLVLWSPVEGALLSLVPTGLQDLQIRQWLESPWLSHLARLQHLTFLYLSSGVTWPPAGPAYSALTASSSLVRLDISQTCPAGVWQYMFPAAHRMAQLTYLHLADPEDAIADPDALSPSWGPADVSNLVSCCAGLRDIECLHLQPGPHASELHKLTALTRLRVTLGPDVEYFRLEESMWGLGAVTQLHSLQFKQVGQDIKYACLLPLTRLTALTSMEVEKAWGAGCQAYFVTQDESAPDVWLQLLQRCAGQPDCCPSALCSLAQQLAEQKALTAQLQQQVAEQQQGAAVQQQLVADLQHQVAGMQQEQQQLRNQQQRVLAQEQLIAVQQQQQISTLQGQLQELQSAVQQLLPSRQAAG